MSLRFHFLLTVNLTLISVLAIFLYLDIKYQQSTHLSELTDDAKREVELLARAVNYLDPTNRSATQALIDETTAVLQGEESTRRDFAIASDSGKIILPSGGRLDSGQIASLIIHVDGVRPAVIGEWVISKAQAGDMQVYLFRNAEEARAVSARHARWRLAEVLLFGLLATGLINLLLIRLVLRPFSELAQTIREIRKGELGATTGKFKSREFQLLAADLNQMSMDLKIAEAERGIQMSKANRLQQRLQSGGISVPGLKVMHWHEAADHVAGDYFDLLCCPDGSWLICIADVTGHGVAAAMGAAILKTLLWSALKSGADLNRILQSVNQQFSEVTLEEDFASLLLIRWSPKTGMLQYASAGHETAYLLTEGQPAAVLESTGTLLGLSQEYEWDIKDLVVTPGSRLILYTDGITEASSKTGELFGRKRLSRLIETCSADPIEITIDRLVAAMKSHLDGCPVGDDVTLVGLEFTEQPHPDVAPTSTAPSGEGHSDD